MTSKKRINRHDIIKRLIRVPNKASRQFWMKEMSLFKRLEARYSLEFLEVLTYDPKPDSLAYFRCDAVEKKIDLKWKNFHYSVDQSKYVIPTIEEEKSGKDFSKLDNTPRTTKQFLS